MSISLVTFRLNTCKYCHYPAPKPLKKNEGCFLRSETTKTRPQQNSRGDQSHPGHQRRTDGQSHVPGHQKQTAGRPVSQFSEPRERVLSQPGQSWDVVTPTLPLAERSGRTALVSSGGGREGRREGAVLGQGASPSLPEKPRISGAPLRPRPHCRADKHPFSLHKAESSLQWWQSTGSLTLRTAVQPRGRLTLQMRAVSPVPGRHACRDWQTHTCSRAPATSATPSGRTEFLLPSS